MGQFEQLDQLLETQDGMLRTAQVVSAGISKPVFYDYVHSRELERVAHGIYLSKDAWVDAMYLLHLRVEQAVFSHETALFFHDLTTAQTPFGHTVPVYDLERTICDLLRSRNNMEMQTFQGALKMYARRKDKDLRTLMRYAGMFRVEKILRQYLEVLL